MKSFLLSVWEVLKITALTLAVIIPVRYYLMQPFFVKGASMEPNFEDGQYLIIDEISYRLGSPERGDVVVFRYPLDPSQFYIKRIIGLPGETVEVLDGRIKIFNQEHPLGLILDEAQYLPNINTSGNTTEKLDANSYFVLGDNRQASYDSRRWGVLPKVNLIGKVWLRAWPLQTAHIFNAPVYSQ